MAAEEVPQAATSASCRGSKKIDINQVPVVLVAGFLAPVQHLDVYFGAALSTTTRPVFLVKLSPVGSCEDRARQLFYQLKGGQVDFGARFADRHLHDRFGVKCAGQFKGWCEATPVHLVGHSFGGQTIRVLQQLLHEGAFEGHATSAQWARSITCISSPVNGSLAVYALGAREGKCGEGLLQHVHPEAAGEQGRSWWGAARNLLGLDQPVWCGSVGHTIGLLAHVLELVDVPQLTSGDFSFDVSRFGLARRRQGSCRAVGGCMEGFSPCGGGSRLFQHANTAPADMTLQGAYLWNRRIQHHSDTAYLSFVGDAFGKAGRTAPAHDVTAVSNELHASDGQQSSRVALQWLQWWQGWHSMRLDATCFPFVVHPGSGEKGPAAWQDGGSDGLLAAGEQAVPWHTPSSGAARALEAHVSSGQHVEAVPVSPPPFQLVDAPPAPSRLFDWLQEASVSSQWGGVVTPGVWHVFRTGSDHVGVVPSPPGSVPQAAFFKRLWGLLDGVDALLE